MNQYRCETCKNYEDDDGKSACNIREEWISTDVWNWIKVVGCASHSDFQSERDKVLDVGGILESLCKTDLYWYNKGVTEGEDVGKCRGKDCNYCGRYNEKLRHRAGEP